VVDNEAAERQEKAVIGPGAVVRIESTKRMRCNTFVFFSSY
jgi:hypothetical protein